MRDNLVLISAPIVYKDQTNGRRWLITKQEKDGNWEIPKVVVRKVESSVRAAMRMMGEKGGMSIKVLEEAGRWGGVTTVNGKAVPQRQIYYLARLKSSQGETIGFEDHAWLEYAKAVRKLRSKIERSMIKGARKELKKVLKKEKEEEESK